MTGRPREAAPRPSRPGGAEPDRAVSPVIGAVLMFALLVALLGVLQATAVPELTRGAEFQHNQEVRGDIIDVSGAVSRTAATGSGESVTVRQGLRYSQRLFFINPPPVSGTLRTTDPAPVTIENAVAEGEAGDVWNGSTRTYTDRALLYRPSYNEYDLAPRTRYRAGVVANEFESATLVAAGDSFVDGRRVALTMLAGDYESNGVDRVGLVTQPLSAPARSVTVTDDGGPVTVTVPTALPESRWMELLAEERVSNGGHITAVSCSGGPGDACGRLTVRLEPGVGYQLRLAQVGLGGGAVAPGPAYLVEDGLPAASVPAGTRTRFDVAVRDRFDNPVAGAAVDAVVVSGPGTISPSTDRSESDGGASTVYRAPDSVTTPTDVTVEFSVGRGAARTVRYTFQVTDSGGRGNDTNAGTGEPTVSIDGVSSREQGRTHRFDVDASATDPDGSLERLTVELLDPDTDAVLASERVDVSGASAGESVSLSVSNRERRSRYRLRVTAAATDGDAATTSRFVSPG